VKTFTVSTEYMETFLERGLERLIISAISIVVVVALAWFLARLFRLAMARLDRVIARKARERRGTTEEIDRRVLTLGQILRRGGFIVIWTIAAMIALKQAGIDIAPILAGAGVLGIAVGFGAQSLVRDLISGFFIILEDQIRVGDMVVVNGQRGTVESLDLRNTILRDDFGVVHYFANGAITTVANMTRDWSAIIVDVSVAVQEDTDRVAEIMRRVAEGLRQDLPFKDQILGPPEILGLETFNETAAVMRVRLRTRPLQQWAAGREYRDRLRKALLEAKVELPSAPRFVGWGTDDSSRDGEVVARRAGPAGRH
jgi:moderate conductance mechanosensitive channel